MIPAPHSDRVLASDSRVGVSEYAFLLLLIVFPAMGTLVLPPKYFAEVGGGSLLASIDIGKITFYASAIGIGFLCVLRYRNVLATALKALPILAFVAWLFGSSLWAPEFSASFNTTGRVFVIVLGAIYLHARMTTSEIITILTRSFAISITISLICVIFVPKMGYNIELMGYESAWRGAMAQKNFLGGLMLYGVFIGYYSVLFKSSLKITRFYVIFGSLLMVTMSQSATATISVATTTLFLCLLAMINNAKNRFEKLIGLWIFLTAMALVVTTTIFSEDLFQLIGRSGNLTGRSQIWPLVWELVELRPLIGYGHGFWSAETATKAGIWARGGWVIAHAHNSYLDIWFQTGFVGLVIALTFIMKGVYRPILLAMQNVRPAGFFWGTMFFATVAKSFTETQWVDPNSTTMFWTTLSYIGLAQLVAVARRERHADAAHQHTVSPNRIVPTDAR